jgi:hypothetical protein
VVGLCHLDRLCRRGHVARTVVVTPDVLRRRVPRVRHRTETSTNGLADLLGSGDRPHWNRTRLSHRGPLHRRQRPARLLV